nr:hypothetical protein [Burkholderia sp. AU15512]
MLKDAILNLTVSIAELDPLSLCRHQRSSRIGPLGVGTQEIKGGPVSVVQLRVCSNETLMRTSSTIGTRSVVVTNGRL